MLQNATENPAALVGTEAGKQYGVQNLSRHAIVKVSVGAAAPAANAVENEIDPRTYAYVTPGAGESIFVWCEAGEVPVAYNKAM